MLFSSNSCRKLLEFEYARMAYVEGNSSKDSFVLVTHTNILIFSSCLFLDCIFTTKGCRKIRKAWYSLSTIASRIQGISRTNKLPWLLQRVPLRHTGHLQRHGDGPPGALPGRPFQQVLPSFHTQDCAAGECYI